MFGTPELPPLSTLVLAGITAGLAYAVVAIPLSSSDVASTRSAEVTPERSTPPQAAALPNFFAAAFDPQTLERPVFAATRRPVEPQPEPELEPVKVEPVVVATPAPAPPPPPEPPELSLKGTMRDGDTRTALIAVAGQAARWFRPEGEIDGWTIIEIGPSHVTLSHEERTHRVGMHD